MVNYSTGYMCYITINAIISSYYEYDDLFLKDSCFCFLGGIIVINTYVTLFLDFR